MARPTPAFAPPAPLGRAPPRRAAAAAPRRAAVRAPRRFVACGAGGEAARGEPGKGAEEGAGEGASSAAAAGAGTAAGAAGAAGAGNAADGGAKEDIVERAWRFFFGAKEAEPFGLKRFDRDRFPELYPATLDEFADAVEGDCEEVALVRPLLARTQLQTRQLKLVFDADVHGWDAVEFHKRVDRMGASVGVMRTEGAVFGMYNPKGSIAAFLFTWQDGDTSKAPVKLRKVGRGALACMDEPDAGPRMGADALVVPLRPPRATWDALPEDRVARSKLGSYYEKLPSGDNRHTLFAKGENYKGELLTAMRVYSGVYAEGEEIPFDDALPFSLE